MASRKDLAGLAALGALGYMLNKDKGDSAPSMRGGAEDERPAPTGMGEATRLLTPDRSEKDFGGSSGTGEYAPGPSSMMRREPVTKPRSRPVARPSPAAAPAPQKTTSAPVNPIDELNRATNTKPMDPNAERGPNAVTGTELDRNVSNAMNAVGGGGLRMVRNLARAKAEADMARAAATKGGKLSEYITPELGYSQKLLQGPTKQLTGPSKAELVARDRAGRAAGREAERTNFNRYTNELGAADLPYKKGGKVKKMASGGMARSSASKRGDGIASKGKTKGRIY
jgi:hypothetical protein